MRRLLSFDCEGAALGASLDSADGETGLLLVTGGTQTRIGSHRMYERLALSLAQAGWPCFRYDRRGVGDSEGDDPDFKESGPDLVSAAAAFRREQPRLKRLIGFGLCDGASTLALHGRAAGLDGYILANPWFVEAEAGEPAAAAIKSRYKDQLLSLDGWKRLLSGAISYRKVLKGLGKIVSSKPSSLAGEIAVALGRARVPA
ncbi:MAG TPA: hydrolase 1, exosortase A system-associated, partial [Allosphingosinicella sp.]|nr:hydrolase 1, exosortase A system-associated [Allosphingosinicella sp.]